MGKETKNDTKKQHVPSKAEVTILGSFVIAAGLASIYGWWKLEALYFTVPLYIIAAFCISFGASGILDRLMKGNYGGSAMFLTWCASLVYPAISTDITALRWLSIVFALFFGIIGFVFLAIQISKDMRINPPLRWIIAILIIPGLCIMLGWYFAYPAVLLFIPFVFILLYVEYLRSTFLGRAAKEPQSKDNKAFDKFKIDVETPSPSFRERLAPRDVLRNLASIRWSLYGILTFFFVLFYIIATQVAVGGSHFSAFYEAVIYAYLGILAIVIAFAVLVLQRRAQKQAAEHLKRALTGLVQMYVVFVLITVTGLLLGTDINGEVLTRSVESSEIFGSMDAFFNICRILAMEFTILAFPAGLLYLHAMIRDFLKP